MGNTRFLKFDLALFDGGAGGAGGAGAGGAGAGGGDAGGGAGTSAGVTGESPAPQNPNRRQKRENPLANVRYGIQPTQDTSAQGVAAPEGDGAPKTLTEDEEWAQVETRFKDRIGQRISTAIQDRFKNANDAESRLTKLAPLIEDMAKKYGKEATDLDGLMAAYTDDDRLYEDEALERGLDVATLKHIKRLEADKAAREKQDQVDQQQRMFQQHLQKMVQDFESVKKTFPQADLRTELQNPHFARLTSPDVGVSVSDAYYLIHRAEIEPQAMQVAAQRTAQKLSQSMQSGINRPTENGARVASPGIDVRDDPTKWSKADREEVKRRARRGEQIFL